MKDYGVSRRQRFEEEKGKLLLCSLEPYEISQWKEVAVHPDCHFQVLNNFYSVPFVFVGQKLRGRIREKTIEVFTRAGDSVTAHARLQGKAKYSTYDCHYPELKQQLISFDIKSALAKALVVGPKTYELVTKLFDSPRPLKKLRSAQGMLRLWQDGRYKAEALEYASAQCLTYLKFRVSYFTDCAHHFAASPKRLSVVAPQREASSVYLHRQEGELEE